MEPTIRGTLFPWSLAYDSPPEGFSLAQILNGLAGYPLFGVVCTGIWSGGWLEDLRKEIRSTEPLQ